MEPLTQTGVLPDRFTTSLPIVASITRWKSSQAFWLMSASGWCKSSSDRGGKKEKNEERYRSGRNGVDSKSTCPVNSGARGFESHPLRQFFLNRFTRQRKILRIARNTATCSNSTPSVSSSFLVFVALTPVGALDEIRLSGFHCGEMSELAEGARLEIACTAFKAVPRVRIPLSPPGYFKTGAFVKINLTGVQDKELLKRGLS